MVNHFHNPLADSWATAGLSVGPFQWFSSVVWQQHPAQETAPGISNGRGSWSWPNARQRYFDALTLRSSSDREAAFARLFRNLGQMMHLVQDASVPAHVRNDPHLTLTVGGITFFADPDGYEHWVDHVASDPNAIAELLGARPPVRPLPEIFAASPAASRIDRSAAPATVSALIDAGQYTGKNPAITAAAEGGGVLVGLAEYANANFLSKDTNSLDDTQSVARLPYPSRLSVEPTLQTLDPRTGELRVYFSKVRDGEPVQRLAVATALYDFLPPFLRYVKVGLDGAVHAEYAEKLLPRAVGYSAALVDYFFRGTIEARLAGNRLRVTNRTAGETMSGELRLFYDAAEGERVPLGQWPIALGPSEESQPLLLPPMPANKPPAEPDTYLLVFRGRLGVESGGQLLGEEDAVVGLRFRASTLQGNWLVVLLSQWNAGGPVQSTAYVEPIYETPRHAFLLDEPLLGTYSDGAHFAAHYVYALYRDLGALAVTAFTASLGAWCLENYPSSGLDGYRPVPMDVVELYPPGTLEDLQAIRLDATPPQVKRVLKTFAGSPVYGEFVTEPIDVSGAQFLGVRVLGQATTYPPAPAPPYTDSTSGCTGVAILDAIE